MAYTQAQWDRIQSSLDPDARMSYLDYIKSADPAKYAQLTGVNPLQALKTAEATAATPARVSISAAESAAQARAEKAAITARSTAAGSALKQTTDARTAQATADSYYTKIVSNGKTQAQLDAASGAASAKTAADKAAADKAAAIAAKNKAVAAVTDSQKEAQLKAKAAADKAAADKIAADKAAADKAAADKALVDKATADKAAVEAAAAAKAEEVRKQMELLQQQIDALIAAGLAAEAQRVADEMKRLQLQADNDAAAERLRLETKYAYDAAAKDKADDIKIERVSAYQNLKLEFEKYGLGSLVDDVEALIMNGTPKSEAVLKLRKTSAYKLRFAGNEIRLAEGKNLYDESTYLELENDFRTSFEAYGQKALLGKTRESAQSMFAEYIGSDKSPTEIKDRIRLAVEEVENRKDIRAEFQKFFPEITDSDLVSYFLKPKETLTTLTSKVRIAQIGSAASRQGLDATLTTATDLEQLGLTEQQARTGYQKVATDLPTIEKLGSLENTKVNQATAEGAYLKGLASEQRKLDAIAERERNRFAQSSGMNKVSLTSPKTAGQY
jgi:hypothetical protein